MSYARFGWDDSDVYVYLDVDGYLTCCSCRLMPERPSGFHEWFKAYNTAAMVAHLDQHRAAGHTVPAATYTELRNEAAENDAWIDQQKGQR
jgi:hypothetical protein